MWPLLRAGAACTKPSTYSLNATRSSHMTFRPSPHPLTPEVLLNSLSRARALFPPPPLLPNQLFPLSLALLPPLAALWRAQAVAASAITGPDGVERVLFVASVLGRVVWRRCF